MDELSNDLLDYILKSICFWLKENGLQNKLANEISPIILETLETFVAAFIMNMSIDIPAFEKNCKIFNKNLLNIGKRNLEK